MKNYFYDLPLEIKIKIYSYDNTYFIKNNKNIEIIKNFPEFNYKNKYDNSYFFTKIFYNIPIDTNFFVKEKNYKKALLLASSLFVKKSLFLY